MAMSTNSRPSSRGAGWKGEVHVLWGSHEYTHILGSLVPRPHAQLLSLAVQKVGGRPRWIYHVMRAAADITFGLLTSGLVLSPSLFFPWIQFVLSVQFVPRVRLLLHQLWLAMVRDVSSGTHHVIIPSRLSPTFILQATKAGRGGLGTRLHIGTYSNNKVTVELVWQLLGRGLKNSNLEGEQTFTNCFCQWKLSTMKGVLLSDTELVWPPSLILKDRHPAVSKDLGLHFCWMVTKFVIGMELRMGMAFRLFKRWSMTNHHFSFLEKFCFVGCRGRMIPLL